jgi:AraC family transcriptional activator of mtrCDE
MIDHLIDPKKRYHLPLDPQFPLAVKLFSYDDIFPPFPMNWHERLELFVVLAGEGSFSMGDVVVPFQRGDILVVDNMKLHGIADFRGGRRRAMVITFLPEFVYSLGSPLCDSLFLTPFYCQSKTMPPVVRSADRLAVAVQNALTRLVRCYLTSPDGLQYQAGCKAYLLEALYLLTLHFGWSEIARSEYFRKRERSRMLGQLHEYLLTHVADKVSVADAAGVVGMSESKFMKYFKGVTGETFVSYLNRLRAEKAGQLLEETSLSVAEVATEVGFADQSYFVKVFRRYFGRTPSEVRGKLQDAAL